MLLREQVQRLRPLVQQRIHSEIDFLNLRQRVVSTEGELNSLAEVISRTQSEVREEQARLANRGKEWLAEISKERNEYRKNLDAVTQRLAAGSHRVEVTDLRAPMNGVIRHILIKEEGVAQRAEPIMELLPTDDTLEVDARFAPQYRGYLEVGMPALVKVDAYDFTIHGSLPAEVTRISADTIEDSRGQAWFEIRLRTHTNKLHYKGEDFTIKPGMTVTVDVISGQQSILNYILKPFLRGNWKSTVVSDVAPRANATAPQTGGTAAPGAENATEPQSAAGSAPSENATAPQTGNATEPAAESAAEPQNAPSGQASETTPTPTPDKANDKQ
jgi:adhesin transport system membrane fusion protein